jgi:hypothetical protein
MSSGSDEASHRMPASVSRKGRERELFAIVSSAVTNARGGSSK